MVSPLRGWNNNYGVVTAPLVRSMIDCLYNITLILEESADNGIAYHKSGLKKRLLDIEEDQKTYAGKPEWDSYNAQQIQALDWLIRASGFTEAEIRDTKIWKPLGTYILQGKPEEATPHQKFLKTLTHMQWRQYSALSHASFDGYIVRFRREHISSLTGFRMRSARRSKRCTWHSSRGISGGSRWRC